MKRSIKTATKAQHARQAAQREWGCICCYLDGYPGQPAETHHMNDCGRNISQDHTLPLCAWHHRGVHEGPCIGPSLARSKREFVGRYGTEKELRKMVNELTGYSNAA